MYFYNINIVNAAYNKYYNEISNQLPTLDQYNEFHCHPEHRFYYDNKKKCIRSFHYNNTKPITAGNLELYIQNEFIITYKFYTENI